jgi:hypothetical protein
MLVPSSPRYSISNPSKATSSPLIPNSVFIGKVVRVSGGVFVNIPKLAQNQIFGPCKVFSRYPSIGDGVLVGFLDGAQTEIAVFGAQSTNKRISGVDDPILATDAATKKYVDDEILELKAWVQANFD